MSDQLVREYQAALVRYHEAVNALIPLLRKIARSEIAAVVPGAAALVTFGEVNEDGVPILRVRRVLDGNGHVLVTSGQPDLSDVVEKRLDEVGYEYLDRLLDLTGDDFVGEQLWAD